MNAQGSLRAWRGLLPRYDTSGKPLSQAAGFVVDCGPTGEPVVYELRGELPEGAWRELHEYLLIDAAGAVARRCWVTTWSVGDDLGVSAFAVVEGALRNLRVTIVYADPVRVRREMDIIAEGLQQVPADDHATLEFLSRALAQGVQR